MKTETYSRQVERGCSFSMSLKFGLQGIWEW